LKSSANIDRGVSSVKAGQPRRLDVGAWPLEENPRKNTRFLRKTPGTCRDMWVMFNAKILWYLRGAHDHNRDLYCV